jgi:hypothetical protein
MPTKKKEPEPPWQVILEEIRSQNRATIEAVEVSRESLEQQIGELRHETGVRFETLERAVGGLQEGIAGNREKIEQVEQTLAARMDLLEKALGRMDQESRSRDASLEVAVRELKVSVQQNSLDLRDLGAKMEALSRLEERVAALERRSA